MITTILGQLAAYFVGPGIGSILAILRFFGNQWKDSVQHKRDMEKLKLQNQNQIEQRQWDWKMARQEQQFRRVKWLDQQQIEMDLRQIDEKMVHLKHQTKLTEALSAFIESSTEAMVKYGQRGGWVGKVTASITVPGLMFIGSLGAIGASSVRWGGTWFLLLFFSLGIGGAVLDLKLSPQQGYEVAIYWVQAMYQFTAMCLTMWMADRHLVGSRR